ncbi:MAG TPA: site-specific integrase [Candidatus Cloacimonas sp.]|jgi:integrase|nr:site-specific integrase [Candidatus Cloacimonas sp.]
MTKDERIQKHLQKLTSYNASSKIKIRAKATRIHGYSLYFDYSIKGQRIYDFLNLYITGDATRDKEVLNQALTMRRMRESDIAYQTAGFRISNWKRKSDVAEYIRTIGQNKSRVWASVATALEKYSQSPVRFMDINKEFIEKFRDYLLENLSQNTAWLYLNTFKTALNLAVNEEIISTNPGNGITIKKYETDRPFLSQEEIALLTSTDCSFPEIKRAFLFACYSGLRISDVGRLDWKAIDLTKNIITIRQKKTDAMLYVPLLPPARRLLGEPSTGLVFDLPSQAFINKKLKEWAKDAGIQKQISFHTSRHTYAIMAIEAGIEINVIQKLLGHSMLTTTMVYAKIHDKAVFQAADKFTKYLEG